MNIAILGSAFNPPTRGHLDAVKTVLNHENGYDRVLLIPAYQHAFAKSMIAYSHRVALTEAFVRDINDSRVHALSVEHLIAKDDVPVYTFDVLSYLHNNGYEKDNLSFVIGPDNKANWNKFYKADDITQRWDVLVVPENVPVRSTMVRNAVSNNQDIRGFVTPSVAAYLTTHSVYV
ncbi:nicotinate-nicotinamide nucleotide adenylyltransferase [Alteromonas sp. C1M14]|uniref:nicotinate-nicotinamide nucleotide adenylyltransferase n=1 Tax=Alteromonas sp. C1M14 TaxID=2841567 RepID=UPI001C098012|nr:nicotinate-nicotinamide nucleotide adenylyltransferase [Alteromonas sp. C1M14]MBU2977286.1 nicotinate-nicotinamide nucleotide adenylyltransferase [Alteromonas sp. C1M14]